MIHQLPGKYQITGVDGWYGRVPEETESGTIDAGNCNFPLLLAGAPTSRVRHPSHLSLSKEGSGLCREGQTSDNTLGERHEGPSLRQAT